jgi:hypothetical protein
MKSKSTAAVADKSKVAVESKIKWPDAFPSHGGCSRGQRGGLLSVVQFPFEIISAG